MADTRFTAHKILREQWRRDRIWFLRAKFEARKTQFVVTSDLSEVQRINGHMEACDAVDG